MIIFIQIMRSCERRYTVEDKLGQKKITTRNKPATKFMIVDSPISAWCFSRNQSVFLLPRTVNVIRQFPNHHRQARSPRSPRSPGGAEPNWHGGIGGCIQRHARQLVRRKTNPQRRRLAGICVLPPSASDLVSIQRP